MSEVSYEKIKEAIISNNPMTLPYVYLSDPLEARKCFNHFAENQRFFVCGPEGMMETAQESLGRLDVKKEFIHMVLHIFMVKHNIKNLKNGMK